ncbi:MAG: bifunctional UDP-N-acetylmuramoyl-tripeptide:D-alanyl-D-alanine ligase/alanine racemase [Bacteroidales bacterium]
MPHTSYLLTEIASIVRGQLSRQDHTDYSLSELLIDSRQLGQAEHALFFALASKRNDGHRYVPELYSKGVRCFVVNALSPDWNDLKDAVFVIVQDTLTALQQLAAHHRRLFNIPVIGITGSNGKTIIKEWLFQMMHEDKKIVRSPKSYNSQIGVPLSVWQISSDDEVGLFEAGISEPEEMSKLQAIIQPTIGVFTNIGQAHAENFIHLDQKIAEKLKLFTHVDTLIYCSDHLEIQQRIISTEAFKKVKIFTWGRKKGGYLWIKAVSRNIRWTDIQLEFKDTEKQFRVPFTDDASVENALHCICIMLSLNYEPDLVNQRISRLTPIAMRMELKEGINNCSIVNDSYSSDINSLGIALDFLNQQKQHRKKTVILSDILQSGRNENDLYSWIADLLFNKNIDQIIGIGPAISRHSSKFRMEKSFFGSTADFMAKFPFSTFHNESILIKGARVFNFEEIGKALQQKAHETVLEINLNSLVHNLNLLRGRLQTGVKTMVMVKAFSYGSGSYEIANILQFHQVDFLAVAYADEGIELRKSGITLPIMVMNPDEESIDALIKYKLEPEVYSFRILNLLLESRERLYAQMDSPLYVHIKLDTGMYRLGFIETELPELQKKLKSNPFIQVRSVFSHLVASHDPAHDDFTREQISRFDRMSSFLKQSTDGEIFRHILNSGGICRFPEAQFDMVRIGISLYGVPACSEDSELLQNVSTLKSSISQVKQVKAGESVGYNRSWYSLKDTLIAIVPIGYADGLNRKLGNGKGNIVVNGQIRPIVGDVCMDMCMVDVDGMDVKEGDPVVIFGEEYPLSRLAEDMDTIPYEVLTNISRRVKRVYFQE